MVRQLFTVVFVLNVLLLFAGEVLPHEEGFGPESEKVFRVREARGSVWMQAGSSDEWEAIFENMPVTAGYRLVTGEGGFIEIEVDPRTFVRMREGSEIFLSEIDDGKVLFSYTTGDIYVSRLGDGVYRNILFDFGPLGRVTSMDFGVFRIDRGFAGNPTVMVREGRVGARAHGRRYVIHEGELLRLGRVPRISRAYVKDSWDSLIETRDGEIRSISRGGYIEENIPGRYEIERYGEWISVPQYGYVWRPFVTVSGWAPYRHGRWVHLSPFGWTWVSLEPWGWITYHYGSWVTAQHYGWVWVPSHRYRLWYPARARIIVDGERIGWIPLRPGNGAVRVNSHIRKHQYRRSINVNARFARPLVIKTRGRYVVRGFKSHERADQKRRFKTRFPYLKEGNVYNGRRKQARKDRGHGKTGKVFRGDRPHNDPERKRYRTQLKKRVEGNRTWSKKKRKRVPRGYESVRSHRAGIR